MKQLSVLLSAAAAETDHVDPLRLIPFYRRRKTLFVNLRTIRIVARRRIRLMQRQPFLRLFYTIVMKLVIDPARAKRFQQIPPDDIRKLAGVDGNARER